MCRRVTCNSCGKPTYAGCGAHIEQVLGDVAPGDRCRCREAKSAAKPAAEKAEPRRSWVEKLFAR